MLNRTVAAKTINGEQYKYISCHILDKYLFATEKNVMNNGWNMYIYKESFSLNLEKTLTFDCFKDKNNKNNETAKNVELI